MTVENLQFGPDADVLAQVVATAAYKPGWSFEVKYICRETEHLAGSAGLTLIIAATVLHSAFKGSLAEGLNDPEAWTRVEHWFAVPPAEYDTSTWERWIFDCVLQVEQHEAMEFYTLGGRAVFFPNHGRGASPYAIERRYA